MVAVIQQRKARCGVVLLGHDSDWVCWVRMPKKNTGNITDYVYRCIRATTILSLN